MKGNSQLEPGLLKTYRLLSWILVGFSTIQAISIYLRVGISNLVVNPIWIFPFGNLLILGILYWPWVQKKTGKYFVPILVVLTTINGLVNSHLSSFLRSFPQITISVLIENNPNGSIPFNITEFNLILASWQLIPLLFIPLIMVAWQYNFKAVFLYTIGSTILDVTVLLIMLSESEAVISIISIIGVILTRNLAFIIVGFLITRMMTAQRQQQLELRRANQQLLGYTLTQEQLATSRERNRLARELHDTLAHTLSGLAVQLSAIKSIWQNDSHEAQIKLDDAISTTRSGLNETRRALQALRAEPLENLGLSLALQELAQSAASRCGAELALDIGEFSHEIPSDISQAFYRAAQEGLENIVRHSEATHITLKLKYMNQTLTLQLSDDGLGFNSKTSDVDSFGLLGLKERASLIGGDFSIDSGADVGSTLIFSAKVTLT